MFYTPFNEPVKLLKAVDFHPATMGFGYELTEDDLRAIGIVGEKKREHFRRLHALVRDGEIVMHADKEFTKGTHTVEAGHHLVHRFMNRIKKLDRLMASL